MTSPARTGAIILIGLRGSGKSTIGRSLADELDRPFIDLDDLTASHLDAPDAGAAIRAHGIDAFRAAELSALTLALETHHAVIALGGGTPTAPGASESLADHQHCARARLVYLLATPETLARRLAGDPTDRPPLIGADPIAEIAQVFAQRDEAYRRLADTVIDVDTMDHDQAVAAIRAWAFPGTP